MVGNAISRSSFNITKYNNHYTISAYKTWASNGLAWFTLSVTSDQAITAAVSTIVAYFDGYQPFGTSAIAIRYNATATMGNVPVPIAAWSAGSDSYIYVSSSSEIPANSKIIITGCYPYAS